MAGYSGTPLPKKLGIKEGAHVAAVHAPQAFEKTLGELPDGVVVQRVLTGTRPLDVIVVFVTRRADFESELAGLRRRMSQSGALWVAWPKKSSGLATDVTEDVVRSVALPTGLVDNKVCAIDETWSGLRLVIRLENRR
jgi:hypothetical protein